MSPAEIDAAIDALHAKKDAWTLVPLAARVELLERSAKSIAAAAEKWVELGARIKGIEAGSTLTGEEWLSGPLPTLRNVRLLAEALRQGGAPRPPALWQRRDGRTVARVFPASLSDRLLFTGFTAEVWIRKGEAPSQGASYRAKREGRVCLVLGGGNVSSIPPMDALYKLFVENEVVALKLNPVNETLGPVFAEALEPLITPGWLALLYGGADVGAYAAKHDKVGSLHITGSARTYDAIVWGAGAKEKKARQNTKPFSAELGCVTPVLVVPGPWSESDIRFQARHVASMVTHNASFNCNAAKVVIIAKQWLQREAFLGAFHEELARTPARKAYYPGALARYAAFLEQYPAASVVGSAPEGAARADVVPWTVIPDVGANDYALREEAFCGIVGELEVDLPGAGGPSAAEFLRRAVALANDACWGTLSCCVLVHPATMNEHAEEIGSAIDELRYGAIGINVWPGVIYGLASPTWGAFPGHGPEDIQSGTGVVHNTWLFDHPEKSVVRAPFRIRPTPPWFADHKNLQGVGRELTSFEATPSYRQLWRVVRAALRG